jgi:uncharacterized protein (TIGR02246 family)
VRAAVLSAALLVAVAGIAANADVPGNETDAAAIRAIVADLDEAWARADADRWASHYAPEAQFINILGMLMPDVPSMRARHHEIFTGVFAGSRHHGTLRSLRFLTPDVAIADVDIEVTGFEALPPGARATEPGVLRTRMRHVLQRLGGRWRITATQNTAVAPAG